MIAIVLKSSYSQASKVPTENVMLKKVVALKVSLILPEFNL
jgi:hypothetical protein